LGIEEQSNEDGLDISNRLGEFVEYVRVQDKAFSGSMTNLVRIRDPCTGQLLVEIRDPKIDINPYSSMEGVIDIQEALEKQIVPIFNREQLPITFEEKFSGW